MLRVPVVVGIVFLASAAHALDVTSCGQTVPARETGFLQADLACPSGVGVHLADKATLDLNGHTLAATADSAIVCDGKKCRVLSTAGAGDVSGGPDVDCIVMPIPRGKRNASRKRGNGFRNGGGAPQKTRPAPPLFPQTPYVFPQTSRTDLRFLGLTKIGR